MSKRAELRRRGITLIETVVSLAIVGVTAIAALEAAGADLRATARARRAIEADALATERLAFLGLLTEQEIVALPDSVASGRFPAPLDGYHWTTKVTTRDDIPGVYDVTVQVAWSDGSHAVHSSVYRRPAVVTR